MLLEVTPEEFGMLLTAVRQRSNSLHNSADEQLARGLEGTYSDEFRKAGDAYGLLSLKLRKFLAP